MVPRTKHGFLGRIKTPRERLVGAPRLASFLASDFPTPPPTLDYRGGITQWGMLGNDRAGDCVWAAILHSIMARIAVVTGKLITFTDADALGLYSAVTGYDPATGANDNGTDIVTALEYWKANGIFGHKIAGWATVDPTNPIEVRVATQIFGPLIAGVNLPRSAELQTDAGQPWSVVPFSPDLGGHCIPYSAYGDSGETCETWGADQAIAEGFTQRKCDELYLVISEDWLDAQGFSPTHLDFNGLIAASAKFGS